VLALLTLHSTSVEAQPPRRLEPVVVTGTLVETPAEQVGASVTVVPGEEIEARRYLAVDEVLRFVPGVDIRRSGTLGKQSSIAIRGANPNQVQVMIDGVRVKSPTLGQVDLSDIPPDLIERIEVIRGPQSTLYGADAIGGVVNIITKKGRGPFGASLSQEIGTYDTLRSQATASGAWKRFDYAVSAYHLESNGQFKNDGLDQNAFSGRFGLSLPWDSTLDLVVRVNRNDIGAPIEFVSIPLPRDPVIDPNTTQETETSVFALTGRTRPVSWWESELKLSRFSSDQAFIDRPDPFPCPPITGGPPCDFPGTFDVERREATWLNHFHAGKWSTTSIGLEYRHEEANVQGASGFGPVTWTQSAFLQQQFRFFDRLFLSGGVRLEDNRDWGTEVTERGSLAFLIPETGTRIRGGAGSGFRAPTFNDLFFPGFSNPDLQPEDSFSWDVGIDQRLLDNRVRIGLTYFHNRFSNLIACCVLLAEPPFVQTGNIGRARSAGIEFTADVDLLDTLVASVNYTYTDSENLITDRPLPNEPRHRWNGRLTWTPVPQLSLFGEVHARTRQFETISGTYNTGHTRVDAGGTWRVVNRYGWLAALDVTARIDNVLDEEYAEVRGFPALGRMALVGLRASF
jgi:vitamin B12 transporter